MPAPETCVHARVRQVQKGDVLLFINDTPVEQLNIDELEWHIFGRQHEMVVLTLFRPSTGQNYQVRVNRHIPIQFALGMSVTREPPYSVKRVDELLDPNNDNIGDMVEAGDLIEMVNGRNCMKERMRVLEARTLNRALCSAAVSECAGH